MVGGKFNEEVGDLTVIHSADEPGIWIDVPDADLMFRGTYERVGADLQISGSGLETFVIPEYFSDGDPAGLRAPNGALIFPQTVKALAGPIAPGQFAQNSGQASDAGGGQSIGTVETLTGTAFATRADGVRVELVQGDPVFANDVVETIDGAELSIIFVDDTVFTLSDNARMVLDELIYNPDGSDNSMLFNLVQGSFVFVAGQVAPTGDMQIKTPVATMGIRGTTVLVEIRTDSGVVKFDLLADKLVNPGPEDIGRFDLRHPETGEVIATVDSLDVSAIFQGLNSPPVLQALTSAQVSGKQEQGRSTIEIHSVRVQNDANNDNQDNNNEGEQNAPGEGEGEPGPAEGQGEGEPEPEAQGQTGEGEPPVGEGEPPAGEGEPPAGEGDPPAEEGEPQALPGEGGPGPEPVEGQPDQAEPGTEGPPDTTGSTPVPQTSPTTPSGPGIGPSQTELDGSGPFDGSSVGETPPATGETNAPPPAASESNSNTPAVTQEADPTPTTNTTPPVTTTTTATNNAPVVTPIVAPNTGQNLGVSTIDLLAGQTDPDGDGLSVQNVVVTSVPNQTVPFTLVGSVISIDGAEFNGRDAGEFSNVTITYNVSDGKGGLTPNTATLQVAGQEDSPIATPITVSPTTDGSGAVLVNLLSGQTDPDDNDTLAANVVSVVSSDTRVVNANINNTLGTIEIDPTQFDDLAVGQSLTLTVNYTITDGDTTPVANTATLVVSGTNDAPVVTAGDTLAYTENDAATAFDATFTIADVDDTNIESATVQITGNFQTGEDVLAFTNQNGITGSFNATNGTMTLTGSATLAHYQTALRTITYENTSNDPDTSPRTVTTIVNDGDANSTSVTSTINVAAGNDAPIVSGPVTGTATEDGSTSTLDPLANASDLDSGDTLTVTNVPGSLPDGVTYVGPETSSVSAPTGLAFTNTNNISLTNAQLETGNDQSDNPNVVNGNVGNLISYTEVIATPFGTAGFEGTNLDDGDIGTGVASDGTYALPGAGTASLTLDFGSATTIGSIAIYNGYRNRDDGDYTLKDGAGNILGGWSITTPVGTSNDSVHSFWLTFDTPITTDKLVFDTTDTDTGGTNSYREIQVFGAVTPQFTIDPTHASYQALADGQTQNVTVNYDVSDGTTTTPGSVSWTVTGTNDAPVVTAGNTLAYTELSILAFDPTITVADADDTNIESATVQITGNFQSGFDYLNFTNQNGIAGSFNTTDGTLTLTGSATVAQYQTALRSITFQNTTSDPGSAVRTVTTIVNDGDANSTSVTSTINVTPVNDPPFAGGGGTLNYSENDAPTPIHSLFSVGDFDDTNLESATVQITGNFLTGEDVLAFVNQNGITGSFNATNGTMTLTGSATFAHYQTALRSITYENITENPNTSPRTVATIVNDGDANSASVTSTINVTSFNDAPVVTVPATTPGLSNVTSTVDVNPRELDGAFDVTSAVVGGTTFVFVAGGTDDGVSVFSLDTNGSLSPTFDQPDTAGISLNGASSVATATVGATTYLFVSGDVDNGVSVFSVATNGTLTPVDNVTETANPSFFLDRAESLTTAEIAGTTFLFVAGRTDGGISVFSVAANGSLTNVNNTAFASADNLTSAVIGGTTYLFATNVLGDSVSSFSVSSSGVLTLADSVSDSASFFLNGPISLTTAEVGGTTYLFTQGSVDGGISVFSVDSNGDFAFVQSIADDGTFHIDRAEAMTTAVIDGTSYLFVPDRDTDGVSVFSIANNGTLTNVTNFADATTLNGASGINVVEIGGKTYVLTANIVGDSVSVLEFNPGLPDGVEDTSLVISGVSISDVDAGSDDIIVTLNVTSGTLTVSSTVSGGLAAGDISNNGSGTVTLTGSQTAINATLADANGLTYLGNLNTNGTDTLTVTANDQGSTGTDPNLTGTPTSEEGSETLSITINPVNDAPVVTAGDTLAYTENDAATAFDPTITVADVDDTNIEGAAVQITGNFQTGEDVLAMATQNGISATFNSTSGILTLSGSATVAQYQAALRSITYENTSETPNTGARTVTTIVNDGDASSANVTSTITITSVNDPPVALADIARATAVTTASVFDDIDAIMVNDNGATGSPNATQILTNDGSGGLTASDAGTADVRGKDVKIADFDGDGDLDAIVAVFSGDNQLLTNQGGTQGGTEGNFVASTLAGGAQKSLGMAVGDVDGDGDLDAFVADWDNPLATTLRYNTLLINDGNGGFTASEIIGSGVQTRDVALADVDGDGDLDAITVNDTYDKHILINQGGTQGGTQGTFVISTIASNGHISVDVVFGDVDGDGDLDAIIANSGVASAGAANELWTNNGSGGFTVTDLAGGIFNSTSIALGDLDGDGDLDAVVANSRGEANQVLINQGGDQSGTEGVMVAAAISGSNGTSSDVTLVDIDGDGDLDAFISNNTFDNSIDQTNQVLINDGTGSFTASTLVGGNSATEAIAFGDLDGDGAAAAADADGLPNIHFSPIKGSVATNDSDADTNAVLTYTLDASVAGLTMATDGSYVFDPSNAAYTSLGAGQTTNVVANYTVTDQNSAFAQSTLTITVTGTNDIPVASEDLITTPEGTGISYNVTLNDTDGDGDALSVTAATVRGGATFGSVTFSGEIISFVPASDFEGVVAIDYTVSDGNGGTANSVLRIGVTPETDSFGPVTVIVPDDGDDHVTTEVSDFVSSFTNAQTLTGGTEPTAARFVDLDNDGYLDAVVADPTNNSLTTYLNDGTGSLNAGVVNGGADLPRYIEAGDMNNDGKADIVAVDSSGNVRVHIQNSPSSFSSGLAANIGSGGTPRFELGDFNSDGNLDVLANSGVAIEANLLFGDGAGGFSNAGSPTTIATNGASTPPTDIAVGDFNNDGKLDFAASNFGSDDVAILFGNGDGTFAAPILVSAGNGPMDLEAGDVDGDGDIDLVVTNQNSNDVSFLQNNGSGAFTSIAAVGTVNIAPNTLKLADIDADGDLDAIVGHSDVGKISLLSFGSGVFSLTNSDAVANLTTPLKFDVADIETPVGQTILGTNGSETLTGTAGEDTLIGLAGADAINGGDGFDFLIGGGGNDNLNGGGTLASGSAGVVDYRSEETLHDGTQAVSITFTGAGAGTASDSLGDTDSFTNLHHFYGTSQADTFDATGSTGDEGMFVGGMEGADIYRGSDGYDRIMYHRDKFFGGTNGVQANLTATITVGLITYAQFTDGFGDTDLVEVFSGEGTKIDSIRGTNFADTFTGDAFNNSFQGLGGIDTFIGGAGNDEVDFRAGFDNGATSGVTVDLSLGSNQVSNDGFGNTESLNSIERIRGGEYSDTITGDSNQNRLHGYEGNDTISGGDNWDNLSGGFGDDNLSSGSNTWDDNAGSLDYAHEFTWQGGTMGIVANLDIGKVRDPFGTTDTLTGFFEIIGTDLDDVVTRQSTTSGETGLVALGNDGSDVFVGGPGYDALIYSFESGGQGIVVDFTVSGSMNIDIFNGTTVGQVSFGYDGTIQDTFGKTDFVSDIDDVRGTAMNDDFTGSSVDERFSPFDGVDTIDGGGGNDTVDYSRIDNFGATQGVTADLSANVSNDGFGNVDTLTSIEWIFGSVFADNLTGNSDDNVLKGNSGDDTLSGGTGDDYMTGGSGSDTLISGSNSDDGNAAYLGYLEEDLYQGGTFSVIANLDAGFVRDPFGDTDTLTGFFGIDGTMLDDVFLYASAPNDGLNVRGYDGSDVLQGSGQWDQLRYDKDNEEGGGLGIVADLTNSGSRTVNTFNGVTVSTFSFSYTGTIVDGFGDTDYVSDIDEIIGTEFADTIVGSSADEKFRTYDGADVIDGGGGNDDEVDYSQNTSFGAANGVTVDLSSNQATNDGFGNVDSLTNIENIRGSSLGDNITGDAAGNHLVGREGDDTLIGGDGEDGLRGGAGNDALSSGSTESDSNSGWLEYNSEAKFEGGTMGIIANLDAGFIRDPFGDTDTLTGWFSLNGTSFNDVFLFTAGTGGGSGLSAYGFDGSDVFQGGTGFDELKYDNDAQEGGTAGITVDLDNGGTLNGVETFDGTNVTTFNFAYTGTIIDGFGQTDYVSGIDLIRGTNEIDSFSASTAAKERFQPLGGDDIINGAHADDEVDYRKDAQEGGAAGVFVNLSGSMRSGVAADTATDGFGDTDALNSINNIRGTDSADTIIGNAFVNSLRGEGGDDVIEGGAGNDVLQGDAGDDTFVMTVGGGIDEIVDFSAGADALDLTDLLDANFTTGNQGTYITTTVVNGGTDTEVRVDRDGAAGSFSSEHVATLDNVGAGATLDIIFDTSQTTTVTT